MKFNLILLLIFLTSISNNLILADSPGLRNFSFMVIPYVQDSDQIENALKTNSNLRDAISIIQNAFIQENLKVIDFEAKYKKYKSQVAFMKTTTMMDTKSDFLDSAKPDIHTELGLNEIKCADGNHKVRLTLKTFLTTTGYLMANEIVDSNCFVYDVDVTGLVRNATKKFISEYTIRLRSEIDLMNEEGQVVELRLSIDDDNMFDFNSRVKITGGFQEQQLSKAIANWFNDVPELVLTYKMTGNTDRQMLFEEVRLPLMNKNGQQLFPIDRFTQSLSTYLESLNLDASYGDARIIINDSRISGTIYILFK